MSDQISLDNLIAVGANVQAKSAGNLLILVIDTSKNIGPSQSGKMVLTASTGGFAPLPGGLKVNLNIGRSSR